jgi:D-inositol-3-phosphate glycosyltransferase
VELAGYQPDTGPYYREAVAVVAPSHSESFGNVVVEAMLQGLPVLTTAVGVVRDWPQDAPLVVLPVADVPAWRAALERVAAGALPPGLGARARAFAKERYAAEVVVATAEECYRELLAEPQVPQ